MIAVYFIITVIALIILSSVIEHLAENKIREGLLKNYFIGKNSDGRYYIFGKVAWVKKSPQDLANKTFKTEAEAEKALTEFMKARLREVEIERFAKKLETSDIRAAMESELLHERLQEVLAAQDMLRSEQLKELQTERQQLEKRKEVVDGSTKGRKIAVS